MTEKRAHEIAAVLEKMDLYRLHVKGEKFTDEQYDDILRSEGVSKTEFAEFLQDWSHLIPEGTH